MEAQKIAVDAIVALTDCDRDAVTAFIRRLYLAGVRDPKRLTFKGLQAVARIRTRRLSQSGRRRRRIRPRRRGSITCFRGDEPEQPEHQKTIGQKVGR